MKPFSRLLPSGAAALALIAALLTGCGRTPVPAPPAPAPPAATAAGPPLFRDVAEQAGLHYQWSIPGPRPLNILQTIGNGCAFLDYDNSGQLSVLLIGTDHVALYKGDGHGRFTDVSRRMGLDTLKGHFLGCAVGDYDNEGVNLCHLIRNI